MRERGTRRKIVKQNQGGRKHYKIGKTTVQAMTSAINSLFTIKLGLDILYRTCTLNLIDDLENKHTRQIIQKAVRNPHNVKLGGI